jgi:hypothetical protein
MLSKVLTLANLFQFTIVPYATTAEATALCSALKPNLIPKVLEPDDYVYVRRRWVPHRNLRGVAFYTKGYSDYTGALPDPKADIKFVDVHAYSQGEGTGMFEFKPLPAWLSLFVYPPTNWWEAPGDTDDSVGKSHGAPLASNPGTTGYREQQKEMYTQAGILGDKLAQALWATHAYAENTATLLGKVRFDIAPGTPVKIKLPTGNNSDEHATICGMVDAVRYTIDANKAYAATSYELYGLRTVEEAQRFGLDGHPLYKRPYLGGKLYAT